MSSKVKSRKRAASDDSDDVPSSSTKKTKSSAPAVSTEMQRDKDGNEYWEISSLRRVQISEFKGKMLINIREFYEKDGQSLPGKKGISLSLEQYAALMEILPQLEGVLAAKGQSVPRPDYTDQPAKSKAAAEENGDEEDGKDGEDVKGGSKRNHDATSDEED